MWDRNFDFCVKCSIGSYEFTNNFDSKPLIIDNILSLKVPPFADVLVDYDHSKTNYENAGAVIGDIFSYSHPTECSPGLSCFLYDSVTGNNITTSVPG